MLSLNHKYRILFWAVISVLCIWSCNQVQSDSTAEGVPADAGEPEQHDTSTVLAEKKYKIKSGIITYETALNTISVHMVYKTIVYFDDYGMKERRDTYDDDKLTETILVDGKAKYSIRHAVKKAYWSGKAYRGTEPKFGWEKVAPEDKESGKVKLADDEVIAGKECTVYVVHSEIVTAKYAGWNDIVLLTEIRGPGGSSITRATNVEERTPPRGTFEIPQGYQVQ